MNNKKSVKNFCKRTRISTKTIDELYNQYREGAENITRAEFETTMLSLGTKPARVLKQQCIKYAKEFGEDYNKFIKEQCYVSPEFWSVVFNVDAKYIDQKYSDMIPKGLFNDHWTRIENFINSIEERELLEYIKKTDSREIIRNLCDARLKGERYVAPIKQKNVSNCVKDFAVKLNKTPKKDSEKMPLKDTSLPEMQEDLNYKKLLPLNWDTMNKSEKIEFTGKVKHEGFFELILKNNEDVKNFFSQIKKPTHKPIELYVTLFKIPADNYSEEAKGLLKCFVDSLNQLGRAKLQYVACSDPNVIEIREVR